MNFLLFKKTINENAGLPSEECIGRFARLEDAENAAKSYNGKYHFTIYQKVKEI